MLRSLEALHGTPSSQTIKRIWGILLILLLFFLGYTYFSDHFRSFSVERLHAEREGLLAYAQAHYVAVVALFILAYSITTMLSIPAKLLLALTGGLLFGSVVGTLYVTIGATVGATLAFLGARHFFRNWMETKFSHHLRACQQGFSENAFSYLLVLRLLPIVPFVLLNLISGLTRMPMRTFIGATALGIMPCSFVYAYTGRQLGTVSSPSDVVSLQFFWAFILLGLLAIVPVLLRRFACSRASCSKQIHEI